MNWYETLLLILFATIPVAFLLLGYRIARGGMHPFRWSLLETRAFEQERTPDLLAQYDAWEKTSYIVPSPHGYGLKTYYVPCDDPAEKKNRKFAVIAHGFSYTHLGSIKYAAMMKDLGYHVVFYDERYHGESGGKSCTLGGMEQDDLRAVIDDTFARFGGDLDLGTVGESMGAVTALLEQADDPRVRFVISDCAFATLNGQFRHLVKRAKFIPLWPSLPISAWIFKKVTHVDPASVRPIDAVARATVPILFIHGEADRYVPTSDATLLYEACHSPKMLWIAGNGARHAESFRKNRTAYLETVHRFMTENKLNQ
ncbi:MAG TPA: hypothetical protein DCR44_06555 [Acholeplasmatales bacterium]|nr:MAG: hypothetical protein A2Y16_00770 [Tenericutes bacterium GWF2_57_13]HAQ57039.1 hypothetical protein [Acholeplasmatales bacterium]